MTFTLVAHNNKNPLSGFAAFEGITLFLLLMVTLLFTHQEPGTDTFRDCVSGRCSVSPDYLKGIYEYLGKEFAKRGKYLLRERRSEFSPWTRGRQGNEREIPPSVVQSLVIGL